MNRKKTIIVAVVAAILIGVPVCINIAGVPVSESYAKLTLETAEIKQVHAIVGKKCIACHMQNAKLPAYASFPGIGGQVKADSNNGTAMIDFRSLFEANGNDEVALAKLEQSVRLNTMPLGKYKALHWGSGLTKVEQDTIIGWIQQVRKKEFSTGLADAAYTNDAVQPLPSKWPTPLSKDKIELGFKLYHDTRLSGDSTISCASCHDLGKGGTDQAQFSTGVRKQVGDINAPTTLNSAFNHLQFWDGRANDLADQAAGPPLNPIEMDTNWKQVIGKLSLDVQLTALHKTAYKTETWSADTITNAIAEYEKTLLTPDSPLDKYLKGDTTALAADEIDGYNLFKEHSCATCHSGAAMGGQSFEKPVDPVAFFAARGRKETKPDLGRFNATKKESDRYKTKVPLLRNIALTAPYLHDGSTSDLKVVIKLMHDNYVPVLNRQPLSDQDVDKIEKMLKKNSGTLNSLK